MHIPDGYLGPQTYIPLYGVSVGLWAIAQKKLKKQLSLKHVPYLAMAAAFSFLIVDKPPTLYQIRGKLSKNGSRRYPLHEVTHMPTSGRYPPAAPRIG